MCSPLVSIDLLFSDAGVGKTPENLSGLEEVSFSNSFSREGKKKSKMFLFPIECYSTKLESIGASSDAVNIGMTIGFQWPISELSIH